MKTLEGRVKAYPGDKIKVRPSVKKNGKDVGGQTYTIESILITPKTFYVDDTLYNVLHIGAFWEHEFDNVEPIKVNDKVIVQTGWKSTPEVHGKVVEIIKDCGWVVQLTQSLLPVQEFWVEDPSKIRKV